MAHVDKKTTELGVAASVLGTDIFDVVADPGGTPTSKKVTLDVLATFVAGSSAITSLTAGSVLEAIIDLKGDLIAGAASDTPARLQVGANGTVLTAASGETLGLQWAAPATVDFSSDQNLLAVSVFG